MPLLQAGYQGFIKLIETPDYSRFQHEPYSIYKDPVWSTETRKNKAELERVAFYHCDQAGTPQTLSNELGECVWEIKQDTWGTALEINTNENLLEQTNLRFQGQYYDSETGLHYNRYRYYEPFSARYVSKDPIGLFGRLNNSVYVNDPNQWVDPMGLVADYQIMKKAKEPTPPPMTKKQVSEALGNLGTAATYTSVGCGLTVVCAPAAPIIKGAGTVLDIGSAILDDEKSWLQKAASLFIPGKVGGIAGKQVDKMPGLSDGAKKKVGDVYETYVDKTAGAVVDHVIEEQNKRIKTQRVMVLFIQ